MTRTALALAGAVLRPGRTAFAVTYTLLSPRPPICLNKATQAKLILDPMFPTGGQQ
jgi:hypothetical protein